MCYAVVPLSLFLSITESSRSPITAADNPLAENRSSEPEWVGDVRGHAVHARMQRVAARMSVVLANWGGGESPFVPE